jgi:GMP synthase-like glutamine amidotransferase
MQGWYYNYSGFGLFALSLALERYFFITKSYQKRKHSRICVLLTDNGKTWEPPATNFSEMFQNTLCMNESWDVWDVCKLAHGENLPNITSYDAYIITGSRFNTTTDSLKLSWFQPLCNFVQEIALLDNYSHIRLYGGCFGHHLITHALGGIIGNNPGDKFILKAEVIKFNKVAMKEIIELDCCCNELFCHNNNNDNDNDNVIKVIESHGLCVKKLPTKCKVTLLANSESCACEMYLTGNNNNILSFQGHPEFDFEYCVRDRILPSVLNWSKRLNEEEGKESLKSFVGFTREKSGPNALCCFISTFLQKGTNLSK